MTCIMGLSKSAQVYIGADSIGWGRAIRKDKKVFTNGEFLIGYLNKLFNEPIRFLRGNNYIVIGLCFSVIVFFKNLLSF